MCGPEGRASGIVRVVGRGRGAAWLRLWGEISRGWTERKGEKGRGRDRIVAGSDGVVDLDRGEVVQLRMDRLVLLLLLLLLKLLLEVVLVRLLHLVLLLLLSLLDELARPSRRQQCRVLRLQCHPPPLVPPPLIPLLKLIRVPLLRSLSTRPAWPHPGRRRRTPSLALPP